MYSRLNCVQMWAELFVRAMLCLLKVETDERGPLAPPLPLLAEQQAPDWASGSLAADTWWKWDSRGDGCAPCCSNKPLRGPGASIQRIHTVPGQANGLGWINAPLPWCTGNFRKVRPDRRLLHATQMFLKCLLTELSCSESSDLSDTCFFVWHHPGTVRIQSLLGPLTVWHWSIKIRLSLMSHKGKLFLRQEHIKVIIHKDDDNSNTVPQHQ